MSRIGKRKLTLPNGVSASLNGNHMTVKGPLGSVNVLMDNTVEVKIDGTNVLTTSKNPTLRNASVAWGTVNANLNAAFIGVTKGFIKELKIEGVGFKAQVKGQKLALNLGFSHPLELDIPAGIKVETPTPTEIKLSGVNKQLVGQFAAEIRIWKKPEPYNGKGVAYKGEKILRKVGKTAEGTKK